VLDTAKSFVSMRISAISYLNTAPLMWDFEHAETGRYFEISYTTPSRCAAELNEGSADIGLIPAAAYATIPDLAILPGVAIASKRAVRSILLISTKPLEEIRTVALDNSSLTSVALIKVLFAKFWGGERHYHAAPPELDSMLAANDAALLIGDPALQVSREKYLFWDLAEEWIRFTGKPFVFAFWAITSSAMKRARADLPGLFQESRDHGLAAPSLAEICRTWAPKLGLKEAEIHEYLTSNIHYYLDDACLEALQLFYQLAVECNVLPRAPELHFAETILL
jgi:chorismate dehydratase